MRKRASCGLREGAGYVMGLVGNNNQSRGAMYAHFTRVGHPKEAHVR